MLFDLLMSAKMSYLEENIKKRKKKGKKKLKENNPDQLKEKQPQQPNPHITLQSLSETVKQSQILTLLTNHARHSRRCLTFDW